MTPEAGFIDREWDLIVIGAGMGGATLGYRLARRGWNVLFCEQGLFHSPADGALEGDYAEGFFPRAAVPDGRHREILLAAGRWPDFVEDLSAASPRRHIPFLGAGSGGSSALYGAALERFHPADFGEGAPSASHVSAGPEVWPIAYADLEPYYQEAERLFHTSGCNDPLAPEFTHRELLEPPPLSPAGVELFHQFQSKGLHPYRLPIACDFKPGCRLCQGFLCDRNCKYDSARVCLDPALRHHGAHYLDRCKVLRLEADRGRVTGVLCERQDRRFRLRGAMVALAAGALATPVILLRSASPQWPEGLGNSSGLVGRNLMRHCIDLYVVKTRARVRDEDSLKELAFNDFYLTGGQKLGNVQSFGWLPPASMLVETLQQELREGRFPPAAGMFALVKPLVRRSLDATICRRPALATTLEDPPSTGNRVFPVADEGIGLSYRLDAETRQRIRRFRALMAEVLRPKRYLLIKQAENNDRIAHACGTCRMGDDAATSVVDACGRAHGLENLYIVDASVFPTSGGTNPALTIAANALRVAGHIVRDHPR